jgi:hypothetical protein
MQDRQTYGSVMDIYSVHFFQLLYRKRINLTRYAFVAVTV